MKIQFDMSEILTEEDKRMNVDKKDHKTSGRCGGGGLSLSGARSSDSTLPASVLSTGLVTAAA